MYGDPIKRISGPLRWVDEGPDIVAYDGNSNPAFKVKKESCVTHYTNPSIRLSAGPNSPWQNLGTYLSIDDAKKIAELHESSETIPVFLPGKLVGWVDKERTVRLKSRGIWLRCLDFIKSIF